MTRRASPERASARSRLRLGAAVLAACGLGALGLWWAVAGGGPAATVRGRVVTSALFFLVAGGAPRLALGSRRRRLDWLLVPVVASGPLVLGWTGIVLALEGGRTGGELPLALLYVSGPLGLAAAGWVVGGRIGARFGSRSASRSGSRRPGAQGTP